MCGIAGFISFESDIDLNSLNRMSNAISSRGPDASGIWYDSNQRIAFAHRRLSILDLSSAGSQPMISRDGRYVITYNGEIYNFKELKKLLETDGVNFVSYTDTEVLLELISQRGIDAALSLVEGMFAFAVWDKQRSQLTLARDKFGQKPLFFGFHRGHFLFASHLNALKAHASFSGLIDHTSCDLFLRFGYVPVLILFIRILISSVFL